MKLDCLFKKIIKILERNLNKMLFVIYSSASYPAVYENTNSVSIMPNLNHNMFTISFFQKTGIPNVTVNS